MQMQQSTLEVVKNDTKQYDNLIRSQQKQQNVSQIQKIIQINLNQKSQQQIYIPYPKFSKANLSKIRSSQRINSKYSSVHSNQSEFDQNLKSEQSVKGLSYDQIRLQAKQQENSIIEKIKEIYTNIFNTSGNLPCQCQTFTETNNMISEKLSQTCSQGMKWFSKLYKPKDFNQLYQKYIDLCKITIEQKHEKYILYIQETKKLLQIFLNIRQIELDIKRTSPFLEKFKSSDQKYIQLQRLLKTYSCYDQDIGYTQGMNFVASSLIYHCDEWVAFWLMVHIFDLLKMKDIYLPSNYSLQMHFFIFLLILIHQNRSFRMVEAYINYRLISFKNTAGHLFTFCNFYNQQIRQLIILIQCENNIKMEMFCTPWLFSLFGIMIPLEYMKFFIINILNGGWTYIYRLILAYLVYYQDSILCEDMSGIISLLSSQNYKINDENKESIDWQELLSSAWNIEINNKFIKDMHDRYEDTQQRFRV